MTCGQSLEPMGLRKNMEQRSQKQEECGSGRKAARDQVGWKKKLGQIAWGTERREYFPLGCAWDARNNTGTGGAWRRSAWCAACCSLSKL